MHGGDDTSGADRAVRQIAQGMGWHLLAEPVRVTGEPDKAGLAACWELGATMSATLME